jgi:predicted TIM-barrel fold metal-dependent hydrolase
VTVVDIHCHTFNADDLPARGFIRRTRFDDSRIGELVGVLADRLVQGQAPGYQAEKDELDRLLAVEAFTEAHEATPVRVDPVDRFDADVDAAYASIEISDPELLYEVGTLLAEAAVTGEPGAEEGVWDWVTGARRAVRWVKLFGASRLQNTLLLVRNFDDEIDLYTPLVVDMDMGLHDRAETRIREQIELHEKISRLSMLGRLPGVVRARIHPFVGFDPRREVRDRMAGEVETALDVIKLAVATYGFVGVKLYPPMGFKPVGNTKTRDMTAAVAGQVDDVLRELYAWCMAEDVPITVHCNRSNEAHDDYLEFSHPELWAKVLDEFPRLRLNLGHFGGANRDEGRSGWPIQIAALATSEHPHLVADVGNHKIYDATLRNQYLALLRRLFDSIPTAGMADRVMFGSDWYMVAIHPEHDRFLETYRSAWLAKFGEESTESFLGGAALQFLGFDDPQAGSTRRLRARYKQYAPDRIPAWLAGTD